MKKVLALVLASMMVLALCSVAFATDYAISTTSTTHTYEIYQIFTGTMESGVLTNLKYGANIASGHTVGDSVSASDIAALKAISTATYANDQERIAALSPYVDLTGTPAAKVGKDFETSATLPEGYYIIKDKDNSLSDPEGYTLYLFVTLDSALTITPKDSTTTVDKTVTETDDTAGTTTPELKGADYDEGDSIPYEIDINLAANVTDYKDYHVTLTDTLSVGLTPPDAADISVSLVDASGDAIDGSSIPGFTAPAASVSGQKITVTFSAGNGTTAIGAAGDALNNAKIIVTYKAVLNEHAVLGTAGNPNTYTITYSNNPNGTDEGTTPEKEVKVFTYKLEIVKTDGNSQPLQGAGFTLYKEVTSAYTGADTGATIKAALATDVNASKLSDTKYYVPVTMTESVDSGTGVVTHTTDTKIDAGSYVLIETTVPSGYNAYEGQDIVITSTIDADGNLTALEATPSTLTVSSLSTVSGTVENKSGLQLPSTGGIGTTIFYVAGLLLVLGAATILVARRKADAE